jgi:hypothetical protein
MLEMYQNLGTIAEARGNMVIVQAAGYLASSEDRLELTALIANENENSPYLNVADPRIFERELNFFKSIPKEYIDGAYASEFSVPDYVDGTAVPTRREGHSFSAPTVSAAIAKELAQRARK